MDEKLINKIISVAYNDAGLADKIRVNYLASKNPEIKNLLTEYRTTYKKVHKIKFEEFPEELASGILHGLSTNELKKKSFRDDFFTIFVLNPRTVMYTAIASTLIIVFSVVLNINRNKEDFGPYTKDEVILANKQIQESLALIGKIFNKTESMIKNEIIVDQVSKPVKKSINTINNLFLEGGKNENTN